MISGIKILIKPELMELKFYSFDWEREGTVVKQSASAMFGGFAGVLVSILCAVVTVLLPGNLTKICISLRILTLTFLFYRINNHIKLENL